MLEAIKYSAVEVLRDGCRIEIRSLKPDDRDGLLAAVNRTSPQSLRRRFFGAKRGFTEREISFFLNVDFVNHVALLAVLKDGEQSVVGGGRYVVTEPGKAEMAFVVVDRYQGQGIATALLRHLTAIAHGAGINELIAQILPDNHAMLTILRKTGLRLITRREPQVVHVALQLK
jgi:RimJ/RimL family protein N-acetyltransferase